MNEWELKFLVGQFWYLFWGQMKLNTNLQQVLNFMFVFCASRVHH